MERFAWARMVQSAPILAGAIGAELEIGGTPGWVRPTFDAMPLDEAAYLLQGLYLMDLEQLRKGLPGVLRFLAKDPYGRRRLRYIRRDPRERWRSIRNIWAAGGGDCEDLAAAAAAELTLQGVPARPIIYRVRTGLAHAVVETWKGNRIDPSKIGGMGSA